jgi:hypothetical protein
MLGAHRCTVATKYLFGCALVAAFSLLAMVANRWHAVAVVFAWKRYGGLAQ